MIAKELNTALSDDKLREQWLKRVLPALVVTVIYFVFVSNIFTEKANKAEQAFKALKAKGISEAEMPGLQKQKSILLDELAALKTKDQEVQASLSAKAGFLYGHINTNEAVDKIALLMQTHHLRITEEHSVGDKKAGELPRSYANLKQWLSDTLKTGDTVHVHRIEFAGRYVDVYEALKDIALGDTKVMPLFITMKNPVTNELKDIGMKSWTLDLWI